VCISVCLTSLTPCTLHFGGPFLHPQWGRAMPRWHFPLWSSMLARWDVATLAERSVNLTVRSSAYLVVPKFKFWHWMWLFWGRWWCH
jgi:hypothetical protein